MLLLKRWPPPPPRSIWHILTFIINWLSSWWSEMNRVKFWNMPPLKKKKKSLKKIGWMHDTPVPYCVGPIICDVATLPRFQQFIWCSKTFKPTFFFYCFLLNSWIRKTSPLPISSTQIKIWWECVRVVCVSHHIWPSCTICPCPLLILSNCPLTPNIKYGFPQIPALHPAQTDSQTPTARCSQSPAVSGAHFRGISPHMYSGDRILISHPPPCNSAAGKNGGFIAAVSDKELMRVIK